MSTKKTLNKVKQEKKMNLVETNHICPVCQKVFSNKYNLSTHQLIHSVEKRLYICQTCNRQFTRKEYLKRHVRIHSNKRLLVCCSKCSHQFTWRSNMTGYMQIQSGEKTYECRKCLRQICEKHQCPTCKEKFTTIKDLDKHVKSTHLNVKPFICGTCNKGFAQYANLCIHKKVHRKVQSSYKPFSCDICKKMFARKAYLKTHASVHSDDKSFVCSICNKGFSRKAQLRVHTRMHSGEKPYICDTCHKGFSMKHHLLDHFKVHSHEKPFSCSICMRAFAYKSVLKEHENRHYLKEIQDASSQLVQQNYLSSESEMKEINDGLELNKSEFFFEVPLIKQESNPEDVLTDDESKPSTSYLKVKEELIDDGDSILNKSIDVIFIKEETDIP